MLKGGIIREMKNAQRPVKVKHDEAIRSLVSTFDKCEDLLEYLDLVQELIKHDSTDISLSEEAVSVINSVASAD